MAIVLISWVSMSGIFCLALVRAAARRYIFKSTKVQPEIPVSSAEFMVQVPVAVKLKR